MIAMTISPTMLGRIGQTTLEKWAAQEGITANPSTHDERGWDSLLQLSSARGKGQGPLDRAPPETSCFVQVKTTMTLKSSEPISLTNWRRMATDAIPWFVLVVHVNDKLEPDGACLVHIGEAECARVFRRLRELDSDQYAELHKIEMLVHWTEADRLTELHGRELVRRLREAIGTDQYAYVREKMSWHRDLGYEDRARRINLTFEVGDEAMFWTGLADLGAGLRAVVPGRWRANVTDVRFGIEASLHEVGPESGDLEFRAPSQGEVTLQLVSAAGESPPIPCSLFRASNVFPFIPPNFDKTRLAGEYVTCIITDPVVGGPHQGAFSFLIPRDLPVPLGPVARAVSAIRLLINHATNPVTMRIAGAPGEVHLVAAGDMGGISPEQADEMNRMGEGLELCEWFGTPATTEVFLPALVEQSAVFPFMLLLKSGGRGPLQAPYRMVVEPGGLFGAMVECCIHLSDRILFCVAGLHGPVARCTPVPGKGAAVIFVDEGVEPMIEQRVLMRDGATDEELEARAEETRVVVADRLKAAGCVHISTIKEQEALRAEAR